MWQNELETVFYLTKGTSAEKHFQLRSVPNDALKLFWELETLKETTTPRCLQESKQEKSIAVHTFVDTSNDVYGAVSYLRSDYSHGSYSVSIIASKTRVAPLMPMTTPRLELMAAILGLHLMLSILTALNILITKGHFWSDSMNVLYWIRGKGKQFRPFVANRIGEIQSQAKPEQWKYVKTKENPADLCSRGLHIRSLMEWPRLPSSTRVRMAENQDWWRVGGVIWGQEVVPRLKTVAFPASSWKQWPLVETQPLKLVKLVKTDKNHFLGLQIGRQLPVKTWQSSKWSWRDPECWSAHYLGCSVSRVCQRNPCPWRQEAYFEEVLFNKANAQGWSRWSATLWWPLAICRISPSRCGVPYNPTQRQLDNKADCKASLWGWTSDHRD